VVLFFPRECRVATPVLFSREYHGTARQVDEFKVTIVPCDGRVLAEVKNEAVDSSETSAADGAWHQVVVTWTSSGTMKHYVDGVLVFDAYVWSGSLGTTGCLVLGQV
jgi:hypothetical protein